MLFIVRMLALNEFEIHQMRKKNKTKCVIKGVMRIRFTPRFADTKSFFLLSCKNFFKKRKSSSSVHSLLPSFTDIQVSLLLSLKNLYLQSFRPNFSTTQIFQMHLMLFSNPRHFLVYLRSYFES